MGSRALSARAVRVSPTAAKVSRKRLPHTLVWISYSPNTEGESSWPSDGLFERVNDRIKAQIEKVEDMTGDMDPKANFSLIVLQTELERWKYLVRSYLRVRVSKVLATSLEPVRDTPC